jgi:signal transduction histidine kinase
MAWLILRGVPEQRIEIGELAVIGRDSACVLQVGDAMASRRHCELRRGGDGIYTLTDLGSTHGTYVDGRRTRCLRLTQDAEIRLGATVIRFQIEPPPAADAGAEIAQRFKPEAKPRFARGSDIDDAAVLRRDYEKLRVAYELSRAIGAEQDLDALLARIVAASVELVSADRGALLLLHPLTGSVVGRAAFDAAGGAGEVSVSTTVFQEVVNTRTAVLCADAGTDDRFSRSSSVFSEGIRSVICVPLLSGEQVLGVMQVDTLHAANAFRRQDLEVCSLLANQAALAIKGLLLVKDQREQEARAARAERLALVGQVAGGIAHDFNNILSVILAYSGFLESAEPGADPREDIAVIRESVGRGVALTKQLLAFGRRTPMAPTLVSPRAVVAEMESMLRRTLGASIELVVGLEGEAEVRAQAGHLEQIVMNLAVNARDAMPAGGRLTITSAEREVGETLHGPGEPLAPGRYVVLSVRDEGEGMSPEVLRRVFEPFFTTKAPGRGTGLGLATVHAIVKQCGGAVWLESELGRGTCFTIWLPVADGAAQAIAPRRSVQPAGRRRAQILIAEDEDQVRELTRRILCGAGYQVISAASGEEALERLQREPRGVDLLLTDLMMPKMSGTDLVQRSRLVRPSLPVLFMSACAGEGDRPLGEALVPKPFSAPELLEQVERALAGTRPAAVAAEAAG